MSYLAPNFTQIPNLLLEEHIKLMTEAEMRVALAIARKTFGWHKRQDRLSLSQLMEWTGMSRQGVINGIEAGITRGIIRREQDGQGYLYELVIIDGQVNEIDQSKSTETSQRSRPELVNEVDQLGAETSQRSRPTKERNKRNKLKKGDQGGERARSSSPTPPEHVTPDTPAAPKKPLLPNGEYDIPSVNGSSAPSPNGAAPLPQTERKTVVSPKRGKPNANTLSPHVQGMTFTTDNLVAPGTGTNAVAAYYEFYSIHEHKLSAVVEDRLAKRNLDLERWRDAIAAWQESDYKPTNVKGMLDWYHDPSRIPGTQPPTSAAKPAPPGETVLGFAWDEV